MAGPADSNLPGHFVSTGVAFDGSQGTSEPINLISSFIFESNDIFGALSKPVGYVRFKVGCSRTPKLRLQQLQRKSKFGVLRLAYSKGVERDAFTVERAAHCMLASHQREDEWFDVGTQSAISAVRLAHRRVMRGYVPGRPRLKRQQLIRNECGQTQQYCASVINAPNS